MNAERLQGTDVIHELVGNHVEPVNHTFDTEIEATQQVLRIEACFVALEGDTANLDHQPMKGSFVKTPTNEAVMNAAGQEIVRVGGKFLATPAGRATTCCELSPEQGLQSILKAESELVNIDGAAVIRGR